MSAHGRGVLALQRLLELRLELARLALGAQQRTARDRTADLERARTARCAAADAAAALLHRAWDPDVHRGLLQHLALLQQEQVRTAAACAEAQAGVAAAKQRALDLDRRLAVLQRLQRQRERLLAADAARAAAREADLLWLVNAGTGRATMPHAGDGA